MTSPGGLDAVATAVLRFDASSVRPGVMEANSSLQSLYGTVKDNWWGVQNLGRAFFVLGAAVAGGLAGAGAAAVGFQQQTSLIFKNVSDSATITVGSMANIRKGLLDLATTSPVALDNLVKIAQQGALFGIASDQVVDFTKKVADLTVGTNLTVNDIGNLKKVMNEFTLPVSEIDRLGSALFVVEKNTSATAPAILNLTTQYGSMLAQIKATAPEALALSGIMVSLGARGQAAATAVSNLFVRVGQAASSNIPLFDNYAKVAGLPADGFKKLLDSDPTAALARIADGLAHVKQNTTDFAAVLADLGVKNSRQLNTLEQLAAATRGGADGVKTLTQVLALADKAFNDTTAYQKEVAFQTETTHNQIQILKNDFQVLTIGIGSDFLPIIDGVVKGLQNVVLGLNSLPAPLRVATEIFGGVTAASGLFIGTLLLIIPRIAQAGTAIGQLKGLFLEYNSVIKAAQVAEEARSGAEVASELASIKFGGSRLARSRAVLASIAQENAVEAAQLRQQQALGASIAADIQLTDAQTAANKSGAAAEAALVETQQALEASNSRLYVQLSEQYVIKSKIAAADAAEVAGATEIAVAAQAESVAAGEAAAATATLGIAEATGTPIAIAFGVALDFATGPIGLLVIGVTALIAVLGVLFYTMGRNTKATDEYKDADQSLVQELRTSKDGFVSVANQYLLNQKGMVELIVTAKALGIGFEELFAIMRGQGTDQQNADFLARTNAGLKNGVANTQNLIDKTGSLQRTLVATYGAAQILTDATDKMATADNNATAASLGLADANQKAISAENVRAQAELGLAGAEKALDDATLKVTDAEAALAAARAALKDRTGAIQTAEDNLALARIDQRKAVETLQKAEEDLKQARDKAADQLEKDQENLVKAKAEQVSDILKVKAAQEALNDLEAGPILSDIIKATNALADARANLFQSTEKVSDAEFQLAYLQGQGASARDIADAQQAVIDAQNAQADSTQKVVDATTALTAAQAGPTPDQIAAATLTLVDAQNALATATQSIADSTAAVAQDQSDIANDTAYKDAQDAVTAAQIALDAANKKVIDSVKALKQEEAGTAESIAYKNAQQAVIDALFARAQAQVNVIKDSYEILTGKSFTAQQQVDALRGALEKEAATVSGPLKTALEGYAVQLTHLPTTIALGVTAPSSASIGKKLQDAVNGAKIPTVTIKAKATVHLTLLQEFMNGVIQSINFGVIKPLNQLLALIPFVDLHISDIPILTGKPPAGPQLPILDPNRNAFAEGGVATKATFGVFGEAGPEAIIPLSQFASIFAPITQLTAQLAQSQHSQSAFGATSSGIKGGNGDTYNITAPTGDARDIVSEFKFFAFQRH